MYVLAITFLFNGVISLQQISEPVPKDVCIFAMQRTVIGTSENSGSVNCVPEGTIAKIPWDDRLVWQLK